MLPRDPAIASTLLASRALMGIVARSLSTVLEELTLTQFRVLVVIDAMGPQRMGTVAETVGVHPSTLSRTVERLVAAGWIERQTSEESRREVIVALTPKAQTLVDDVMRERRAGIAAVVEKLDDDDRAALERGLGAFARAAGEPSAADLLTLGI